MIFIDALNDKLAELHLLNHCFYQAWNKGELSNHALQVYAKEYYGHVAAFPRYVSAIHSNCDDINMRQVILGNLIEEDQGEDNHPELWQRFAEGLGVNRNELKNKLRLKESQALVDGYFDLVRTDFATGLGALYAYEKQSPEISKSKIEGLKKFYNIHDERSLKFFEVHMHADEWHSDECANLINRLDDEGKEKASIGALKGAKLLWSFLDGMMDVHTQEKLA